MLPFHLPLDFRLNKAVLQIFYIANATYPTSAGAIKLALLFQYLRIYERGTNLWYTTVGTIIIVFGVGEVCVFLGHLAQAPVRCPSKMALKYPTFSLSPV